MHPRNNLKHAHLEGRFVPGLIVSCAEEVVESLDKSFLRGIVSVQEDVCARARTNISTHQLD